MTVKFVILCRRRPGLSFEEFVEQYESRHAPMGARFFRRAIRYERRYLSPVPGQPTREPTYDCITEIWFPDRAALETELAGLASPQVWPTIRADEELLFDRAFLHSYVVEDERESNLTPA